MEQSAFRPIGVLEENAISVAVLKGDTVPFPERIKRLNRSRAALLHARDRSLPKSSIWKIEHQQVVLGQGPASILPKRACELEMILLTRPAEHDRIPGGL